MNHKQQADFIYGTRAIIESIESGKEVDKILIQKELRNDLTLELQKLAKSHSVPIQKVPVEKLNRVTKKNHQGTIAYMSSVVYASLENIISETYSKGETPLLIILDRITDVRNVGAIARTAECAGAHAIVVPSRNTAQLGADAMKTSAGALNYIPVCREENLKKTLQNIRENGIQVLACSEKAEQSVFDADLTAPLAILMGSEENGISPEYLKFTDGHIKLPIQGNIDSLNVSVATGIITYEVIRQRNAIN